MPTKDKEPMEQSEEAIEKDQQTVSDNPQLKANIFGTSLTPLVPFPQMLQTTKLEKQTMKFLEVLKKLHVNIPFIDAILQIPNYSMFLKEMLTKKRKMPEHEIITLFKECNAIIQYRIPSKLKDLGVEDMLIKTGEFIFPADFMILDIEEASQIPIILGRPFLSTSWALLDFDTNEIVLRVEDKQQSFTMENPIKQPSYFEDCQRVDH
ncbi:uncharacterized protein LOC111384973 [Olea europaea var. sylvestris]|uniref:uncharacterized protein LOC111384973 n=1 Tax=Olea europaea var. sylvestris TaxID=158386 RepID=UPI000C1D8A3F|nr:uncharacterized protein LOC111384973 [Olea europaea var. sylvestris]